MALRRDLEKDLREFQSRLKEIVNKSKEVQVSYAKEPLRISKSWSSLIGITSDLRMRWRQQEHLMRQ